MKFWPAFALLPSLSWSACPPPEPPKPGDFFTCDSVIIKVTESAIHVRDATPEEKAVCQAKAARHIYTECEVRPKGCRVGFTCDRRAAAP